MTAQSSLRAVLGVACACAALALLAPRAASGADAAKEVSTAEQHAGFAASAKDLNMVHTHLHHVVNCLVGPKGKGYDSKAANPCKEYGAGAIPDTTDASKKQMLEEAMKEAQKGLGENNLAAAQKSATTAGATLKKAM